MANQPSIYGRQEPFVKTGIDTLDRKLVNGLPNRSVILLMGELGSGYDIFPQQILYNRASRGERAIYLTVERPPEDIVSEMKSYDLPKLPEGERPAELTEERSLDINNLVEKKYWEFINGYEIRTKVEKGDLGPNALKETLQKFPQTVADTTRAGAWSAIDTLSYYLLTLDLKEVLSFVDDMTAMARDKGGLHFLLAVKGLHDDTIITRLANLLDGYFEFSLDSTQAIPKGNLRIRKLRRANYLERSIPYEILRTGFNIDTSRRVA